MLMIKEFLRKSKYNTDNQDLDRKDKLEDVENKIVDVSGLVTNYYFQYKYWKRWKKFLMLADELLILFPIQKSEKLKKIRNVRRLVNNTAFNIKIVEVK